MPFCILPYVLSEASDLLCPVEAAQVAQNARCYTSDSVFTTVET